MPPKKGSIASGASSELEYKDILHSGDLEEYGGIVATGHMNEANGTCHMMLSVERENIKATIQTTAAVSRLNDPGRFMAAAQHVLNKGLITKEEYALMTNQGGSAGGRPHQSAAPFFYSGPIVLTPSGNKDGMKMHLSLGIEAKPGQPYIKTLAGVVMHDLVNGIYDSICDNVDKDQKLKQLILQKSKIPGDKLTAALKKPARELIEHPISFEYDDNGVLKTHVPPSLGLKPMIGNYSQDKMKDLPGVFQFNESPTDNSGENKIFWMKTMVETFTETGKFAGMAYATCIEDFYPAMYASKKNITKITFPIGSKGWFKMRVDPAGIMLPSLFMAKDKPPSLKFSCTDMCIFKKIMSGAGERPEANLRAANASIASTRDFDWGDGEEADDEGGYDDGEYPGTPPPYSHPQHQPNDDTETTTTTTTTTAAAAPVTDPDPTITTTNLSKKRALPADDDHHQEQQQQEGPFKKSRSQKSTRK